MAAIDIGAAAIDRGTILQLTLTGVAKDNPANDTGTIASVEMWLNVFSIDGANVEVATFSASGDNLTTRDSEAIGTVTKGSKQTFSGLDMDVVAGDYIGIHGTAGELEAEATGGLGVWYKNGDYIPCTSEAFTPAAGYILSLYGTGETTVTEKNVSDTGLGVDATPSIAVALSLAETGSGVDAVPALSPTIPTIPDTGLGTDLIAAIEVALTLAETGSGVEAIGILYYVTFIGVADVGEGADVVSLAITIPPIEDSGVGVDQILGEYTKVIADQMYSSEWLGVAASMILSELAEGVDSVAVQVTPIIADTGEGLDSIVINASLNVAEVGSGQEAITITATIPLAETGAGVDGVVAAVSITIADTGQGVDAVLKRVLQLCKLLVLTRSKARMTVQTKNKARITIQLRGGGQE